MHVRRLYLWSGLFAGLALSVALAFWLWIPSVHVARPVRGPAVHAVYATGNVEPVSWAKVSPVVSARIVDICDCEGKEVRKGEVLARLDDREAQANLDELLADERFLKEELQRQRTLRERGIASPRAYERALSELERTRAAIAAQRERIEHLALRAPMDGVVLRRDGEVGEVMGTADVLFWVGQPSPLRIEAEVDEEDVPLVRSGQRVLIEADAFPDRVLDGTVSEITPKGDPLSKSFRLWVGLPADTPLLIGMTTEINVVVAEREDAILVPPRVLDGKRVWVVEDGRARSRPVDVGVFGEERIEITAGLRGDEILILDPPAGLSDGDPVRVGSAS